MSYHSRAPEGHTPYPVRDGAGNDLESLLKLLPQEDLIDLMLGTCDHCRGAMWQQMQQVRL